MTVSTDDASRPTFIELFTPKLVTVLREGYGLAHLRADALAGFAVAIVALPLSMAIAIASGASLAQGLYTAILGGFVISARSEAIVVGFALGSVLLIHRMSRATAIATHTGLPLLVTRLLRASPRFGD